MVTTVGDTSFVGDSQVKKIEIKAKEIKAQPYKHTVEDVYGLLFKSIELNKKSVTKLDSANQAIAELKKSNQSLESINKSVLAVVTNLQSTGQRDAEKMYIVNKYIETMPLAFGLIVLLAVAQILLRRNYEIAT